MREKLFSICVSLVILFISCAPPVTNDVSEPINTENPPQQEYETVKWGTAPDNFIRFYTNDPKYIGPDGWSFWKIKDGSFQAPFTNCEAEVKKISGNEWAGYGMIFCVQDISNFLFTVIDLHGDFMINKVVDGDVPATPLVDWSDLQASNLYQNPGDINKLNVSWQGKNSEGYNVFRLSFNDHEGVDFVDNIEPQWNSGSYGYILSISSMETFPTIPVEVHFK